METLKCHLWSARRSQPLAELSQAERSEAQPREARPPPKAAGAVRRPGAEGDPRASRGLQTKARMRLYWLRLTSWRLNILGRRESVLCTNGIRNQGHYDELLRRHSSSPSEATDTTITENKTS